jgi:hypothetical protein
MKLFETTHSNLCQEIATHLGCDPSAQETWPTEIIERVIKRMERAAMNSRDQDVSEILMRWSTSPKNPR